MTPEETEEGEKGAERGIYRFVGGGIGCGKIY
jgi:hypothetical protein